MSQRLTPRWEAHKDEVSTLAQVGSCGFAQESPGKGGRLVGQRRSAVVEHELGEFRRRVGFARLEPVDRNCELGGDLTKRANARSSLVALEPADVGVADALGCELALAQAELESPLSNSITDGGGHRARGKLSTVTASSGQPSRSIAVQQIRGGVHFESPIAAAERRVRSGGGA